MNVSGIEPAAGSPDPREADLYIELDTPVRGGLSAVHPHHFGERPFVVFPDAHGGAGRDILREALPAIAARSSSFIGHVFLVTMERVCRLWPERSQKILSEMKDLIRPLARVLAGRDGKSFWISSSLMIVIAPERGTERSLKFEHDLQQAAERILGRDGAGSVACYSLSGAGNGRLCFEALAQHAGSTPEHPRNPEHRRRPPADDTEQDGSPRPAMDWDTDCGNLVFGTVYMPVWDVRNEIIAASAALASRKTGDGLLIGSSAVPDSCLQDGKVTDIHVEQLANVARALYRLHLTGEAGFISLALPYEAVRTTRRLLKFAGPLARLPGEHARRLVLALWDIPDDAPERRLQEIVQTLRSHCFGMTMGFRGPGSTWRHALDLDVGVIGLQDIAQHADDGIAGMFARTCREHGRRSLATGVDDTAVAGQLIEAGIDFLSGPAIGAPQDMPVTAQAYYREDFRWRRKIV